MKHTLILASFAAAVLSLGTLGLAQTPAAAPVAPSFIKGTLGITFNTVTQADNGKPAVGAADTYTFDINVSNSSKFHGTIVRLPWIASMFGAPKQAGSLTYAVDCDIVNPKNPAQTKNVGKIIGQVPVDAKNVYHYDDGTVETNIFSMGRAAGLDSKFKGLTLGKPPASTSLMDKIKKQAVSITRSIHGQNVTVVLTNYDTMVFQSHVLSAGPLQSYPEVTVNGEMLYDYSKNTWVFHNLTCSYVVDRQVMQDTIAGTIRWMEDPARKANGKGHYEFDIHVNEPLPTEANAFTAAPTDESAFFQADDSVSSLTGNMNYQDTLTSDGDTAASVVQVDLAGNKLSRQQVMYLTKLLLFSAAVPMNSD
jgi:hypothetical protein